MTNETIIKNIEDCIIQRTILQNQYDQLNKQAADCFINGQYFENRELWTLLNRVQEIIFDLDKKVSSYESKLNVSTDIKCKIHNRYIEICQKHIK